jgi:hypothetical protein
MKRKERIKSEIYQYRLEEAADCLSEYANKHMEPGELYKKRDVAESVAKMSVEGRRLHNGWYIPTIENRTIKPPTAKFIENNWGPITDIAALNETYICWKMGPGGGTFLGSMEDWKRCKQALVSVSLGILDKCNSMAELINRRGGATTYVESHPTSDRPRE